MGVNILGVDILGVDILGRTLLCQCSLSLIHSVGYKESHSQLGESRIELCLISLSHDLQLTNNTQSMFSECHILQLT